MTPALFTHSTCSPQNAHRAFRQRRDNSIIVFRLILEIRMETAVSCRGQLDVNCQIIPPCRLTLFRTEQYSHAKQAKKAPPFSRNKRNKKFLQNIPAPSVSKKLKPGTPCKSRDSGLFACLLSTICVQNAISVSITGRHYPFTAPAITPEMMNFWQARYRTMIGMIASTSMAIIAPISTEP